MKTLKLFFLLPLIAILQSCDNSFGPPEADLIIRTQGYLSGNTRENIQVQVYLSREDARRQVAPITPPLWTDGFGEVAVYGLDVNRCYFVRADSNTTKTIRSSKRLDYGSNLCVIRIL